MQKQAQALLQHDLFDCVPTTAAAVGEACQKVYGLGGPCCWLDVSRDYIRWCGCHAHQQGMQGCQQGSWSCQLCMCCNMRKCVCIMLAGLPAGAAGGSAQDSQELALLGYKQHVQEHCVCCRQPCCGSGGCRMLLTSAQLTQPVSSGQLHSSLDHGRLGDTATHTSHTPYSHVSHTPHIPPNRSSRCTRPSAPMWSVRTCGAT